MDAFGLAPQVLERAEQLGRKAIALTDHDGVWGIPFMEKNNKNGMKLLYGAEMRMIEKIADLKESRTKNHITMIAKNQRGWAKLCNLITRSYDEDHFYYYPTLDIKMMKEGAGDIVIMSGCMSSLVSRSLLDNDLDKAMDIARQFKDIYGRDYYLEIIPIENFPDSVSVLATGLRKISQSLDIPIVLTHDVHQLNEGQTDIWKMLHCIRQRKTMEEIEKQTFATDCYQMEDEAAYQSSLKVLDGIFSKNEIMEMFNNQERIVADCESYKLKKGMIVKFKNAREILEKKAWEGLASRGLTSQVYKDRLSYELELITQKDFCDYFLIVSDLTSWAKRTGYLVGSGRGCFLPGNKIECYGGKKISIEEIKIGATVITSDGRSRLVKDTFQYNIKERCIKLTIRNISNNLTFDITCTEDHKFLKLDNWVKACDLKIRDILMGVAGYHKYEIVGISYFDYEGFVYDIEVEEVHNYNINGVVVHNSAAGGLICYVLRITEVDPIFHDIMFERFISVDRMDPPDIDIDFQSSARQDVLHYLYTKYGRDRAAQIGAFSTFGGKNTLDEVGKMYRVPKFEVESLKDKLVTRIGVELRASFTIMDTIEGFHDAKKIAERYPALLNAVKLEGQIRHFGAQAAGAVVNSFPLNYITPLMEREEKHMVFFDGEISKYLNILKIDTLGINALDKINTALDAIGQNYEWLSKASYEDEKTFQLFNDVDVKGIFQYEKNTGPSLLRQIHIDNFEDLVALNALARPGPLHCTMANTIISGVIRNNVRLKQVKIKDIEKGDRILSHMTDDDGKIISDKFFHNIVKEKVNTGIQDVLIMRAGRRNILATADHRFLTGQGWARLKDLKVGDEIYIRRLPNRVDSSIRMKVSNPILDSITKQKRLESLKNSDTWKTFIDMHNKEMWTEKKRIEHSDTMTEYYQDHIHPNSIRNSDVSTSKPQLELFDFVKSFFEDAVLDHKVVVDKKRYHIDIFVPSLNLGIEYGDTEYWYKDEELDRNRDETISDYSSIKIIRVNQDNIDDFKILFSTVVHNDLVLEKVRSIKIAGMHQTYDLVMKHQSFPNYIANGFVVHNSGATQIYTKAKSDNNPNAWNNDIMDKITERTHGVIIYQEQTLSACRFLGHMEWEDISHVRTIMSKSMGKDYFEKYRNLFVDGAVNKSGVTDEFANHVFDHICFFPGTGVLCREGNKTVEKIIENIKVGDWVASIGRDYSIVFNEVSRVYENQTIHAMNVVFDNGVSIKCTPSHPFYVMNGLLESCSVKGMTNKWIKAMDLSIGDECLYLQDGEQSVIAVKRVDFSTLKDWQRVYNLEVEFAHNYFANGVLVSNCTHGCLSYDALVTMDYGKRVKIGDLYRKWTPTDEVSILSLDSRGDKLVKNKVLNVICSGDKEVFLMKTKQYDIEATSEHQFLTPNGWKKLSELCPGNVVCVRSFVNKSRYDILGRKDQFSAVRKNFGEKQKKLLVQRNTVENPSFNDVRKIEIGVETRKWWDDHPEAKEEICRNFLDENGHSWCFGLTKDTDERVAAISKKLSIRGFSTFYEASDGHTCYSKNELKLEEWLIKNNLSHISHARIGKTHRVSDQLISGFYVEMDGIGRSDDYWREKYGDIKNYIVIYPKDNLDDKLSFLLSNTLSVFGANKDVDNHADVKWMQIQSIESLGIKDTYDITMESPNNSFVANNFIVHNSWSFNRGHSVSYTDISYKMAYLKAHYPRHFYYALLMNEDVEDKVNGYLRDYIEKGYGRVLPPKLNHSDLRWKLEGNDLRAGLTQVKGLGEKAAEQLISLYPIKDMEDLKKRVTKRVVNIRVIRLIEEYKMLTDEEDVDVFGLYDFADRMKNIERSHRMGDITYQFKARPVLLAGFIPMQINQKNLSELEVSVVLKDYSRYNRANGDEFAIFYLKDETSQLQVIVDNKLYPKVKDLLWSCKVGSDIIRVKGVIPPSKMFVNLQEVEKYDDTKYSGSKCYKCTLAKNTFVPPFGNKTSSIMIIGEAPGAKEEEKGQPFVGRSGSLLGDILAELGLDRSHLYISNSVFCRPVDGNKNRTPTDEEIRCCRGHLEWEIDEVKPKVVITMGKIPLAAMLNKKIEEIKISKMVESVIDLETLSSKYKGVLLIPSYHPAAALYSPDSGYRDSIKNSIQLALEETNKHINKINKLKISREKRENSNTANDKEKSND